MALDVPAFIMQLLLIERKKNLSECLSPGRLDDMSELAFSTVDSERSIHVDQEHNIKTEKGHRMTYLKFFQQNRLLNATLMALLQGFVTAGLEVLIYTLYDKVNAYRIFTYRTLLRLD